MAGNHKGGGIKGLLLAHCEKLVGVLLIGFAAYAVYTALGVESEEREPSSLSQAVNQTKAAYDAGTWPDNPGESEDVRIAYAMPADIASTIPVEPYRASGEGMSRAVIPPTVDRPDPKLLAATDLEGAAVTGIFALISEETRKRRELEAIKEQQEKAKQRELSRNNPSGGDRFGGQGAPLEEENKNRRPIVNRIRGESGTATQGDEQFELLSCAVVLAKAPVSEQYRVYKEALEEARDYDAGRDSPRYLGLLVQRAEVRGAQDDPESLDWQTVKVGSLVKGKTYPALFATSFESLVGDWPAGQQPMMDARYEHPLLTVPLPPLVGQNLGPEFVHSEVPLQGETDALDAELEGNPEDDAPEPDSEGDMFAEGLDRGRTLGGRSGRSGGEFGGSRRGGLSRGGRSSGFEGGLGFEGGGDFGGGSFRGGRSSRSGGRRSSGRLGGESIETDFQMIRFFDFSVAPGRQYRYRVQLVLNDVNRNVEERMLARDVVERIKGDPKGISRRTEWSEVSPVISVPLAGEVLLAGAKPANQRQANAEGTVKLLVRSYNLDEDGRAIKAGVEEDFRRGSVLNLTDDAEFVTPDGRWIEKADSFEFRTGMTLVDFDGGRELAKNIDEPVEILLMGPTGRLFVQNSLDDAKELENHRLVFEKEDSRSNRGGRGGGEFGPPGGFNLEF